ARRGIALAAPGARSARAVCGRVRRARPRPGLRPEPCTEDPKQSGELRSWPPGYWMATCSNRENWGAASRPVCRHWNSAAPDCLRCRKRSGWWARFTLMGAEAQAQGRLWRVQVHRALRDRGADLAQGLDVVEDPDPTSAGGDDQVAVMHHQVAHRGCGQIALQ